MQNALQQPQTIVLLGGTSEIGRAIVSELISPATETVVLGCRRPDDADPDSLSAGEATVVVEQFDAAATETHDAFVRRVADEHGDLDVVVIAFGVLRPQEVYDDDPHLAAADVEVNFTGAVSAGLAVAAQFRRQGHGHLLVMSSVAGERARAVNYVYGAAKAGLDAFAQGLGDALHGTGARVTVVRPGFVHTRMTAGMPAAPFATTPEAVARSAVAGMRRGRHTVWTPGLLRPVFAGLRHLPRAVFRRLPI